MSSVLKINFPCSLVSKNFDVFRETTITDVKKSICCLRSATVRYELDYFELGKKGKGPISGDSFAIEQTCLDVLLTRKGAAVQRIGKVPTPERLLHHLLHEEGLNIYNYIYGGLDVNVILPNGGTPLSVSASRGNTSIVKALLSQFGDEIDVNIPKNDPPLASACMSGYVDVVEVLLSSKNIDPNAAADNGRNALLNACWNRDLVITKLLLQHPGIDVNHVDVCGWSALYIGALLDAVEITKTLITHLTTIADTSSFTTGDRDGWTPFAVACSLGHTEVSKLLYSIDSSVLYILTSQGFSPLFLAATNNRMPIVKYLLSLEGVEESCILKVPIPHLDVWRTPLQEAEAKGLIDVCELLQNVDTSKAELMVAAQTSCTDQSETGPESEPVTDSSIQNEETDGANQEDGDIEINTQISTHCDKDDEIDRSSEKQEEQQEKEANHFVDAEVINDDHNLESQQPTSDEKEPCVNPQPPTSAENSEEQSEEGACVLQ